MPLNGSFLFKDDRKEAYENGAGKSFGGHKAGFELKKFNKKDLQLEELVSNLVYFEFLDCVPNLKTFFKAHLDLENSLVKLVD